MRSSFATLDLHENWHDAAADELLLLPAADMSAGYRSGAFWLRPVGRSAFAFFAAQVGVGLVLLVPFSVIIGLLLRANQRYWALALIALVPPACYEAFFFVRCKGSVNGLQVFNIFVETAAMFLVVFLASTYVNLLNDRIVFVSKTTRCVYEPPAGQLLAVYLAVAAECKNLSRTFRGTSCTGGDVYEASKIKDDGSFAPEFFLYTEYRTRLRHEDHMPVTGLSCKEFRRDRNNIIGSVHIHRMCNGDLCWAVGNRENLRASYSNALQRFTSGRQGVQKGCRCKIRKWTIKVPKGDEGVEEKRVKDFCGYTDHTLGHPQCLIDSAFSCKGALKIKLEDAQDARVGFCAPLREFEVSLAYRRRTYLHLFVRAFLSEALVDEIGKFIVLRRLLFMDRVVDANGVLLYSVTVALSFSMWEQISLIFVAACVGHSHHEHFSVRGRSFNARLILHLLVAPMEMCIGFMIGAGLAFVKFLGWRYNIFCGLAGPVLIKGTFDLVVLSDDLVGGQDMGHLLARCSLCCLLIAVAGLIARYGWLQLASVCRVNVHIMQKEGLVSQPRIALFDVLRPCMQKMCSPGADDHCQCVMSTIWKFAAGTFPPMPSCQTYEEACSECSETVRAHRLFKCYCPFCGTQIQDISSSDVPRNEIPPTMESSHE